MKLNGKRVFITGASSGLGEAMTWELSRRGCVCAIASRRIHHLEALAAQIQAASSGSARPLPVVCDVSDRASVASALRSAAQDMGGIDILVNNAGISVYGETERTSDHDLNEVMGVNFLGCVHGMQEVLPYLRENGGGHIVNIASLAAIHGVPYLAAYGASKAALAAFSQSLRAELIHEGITIQVVYPGYTQTAIFANERKLGGAHRPRHAYAPVDRVAHQIVKAMKRRKSEVVLGTRGRWMASLSGILPRVLDRIMGRMADELGEHEVSHHA